MNKREQVISKVYSLPALPAAAVNLAQVLRDPEADINEITKTIEMDPPLTSNILRLANSSYYGSQKTVSRIKDAVLLVGTNSIFQMVFGSALSPFLQRPIKGYDLEPNDMWKHSLYVAELTVRLAIVGDIDLPDFTFTAGLLHDLGKIVLSTFVDVDVDEIRSLSDKEHTTFESAEREILGIDHAETGALLLEIWNLPPCLSQVVRWHHRPEEAEEPSTALDLVHVADALSLMGGIGTGRDGLNYRLSEGSVSRLKLNDRIVDKVICHVLDGLEERANRSSPVMESSANEAESAGGRVVSQDDEHPTSG